MADRRIAPEKITSPIQLLAVWFVALIALNGAFLTAAAAVSVPAWLPTILVVAAVVNVPIFLACMFLLQTRFRAELQSDEHYSSYLVQQRERAESLAQEVRRRMDEVGADLQVLVQGSQLSGETVESIRPLIEELADSVCMLQHEDGPDARLDAESLMTLVRGELSMGNWSAGAEILEQYAQLIPDDFEANYSRGVAFANARDGHRTNIGALRAYNDAIAFLPDNVENNFRARVFTYRGAILKRMHRFDEALADFGISISLADEEYEKADLYYNLASTYAMLGDRERMMDALRKIPEASGFLGVVAARRTDYFRRFADDHEFLSLVDAANKTGESTSG